MAIRLSKLSIACFLSCLNIGCITIESTDRSIVEIQDKSELNLEEGTKIELLANKKIKLGSASVERITMTIIGANSENLT